MFDFIIDILCGYVLYNHFFNDDDDDNNDDDN